MKRYVVGFLLTSDLKNAYFIQRKRPPYAGLLNGFGGKIESGEQAAEAMLRELEEETGLSSPNLKKFVKMMSIRFPSDVELDVFYAILELGREPNTSQEDEGVIMRVPITEDLLRANNPQFAGEGNVAYFLNLALLREGVGTASYFPS